MENPQTKSTEHPIPTLPSTEDGSATEAIALLTQRYEQQIAELNKKHENEIAQLNSKITEMKKEHVETIKQIMLTGNTAVPPPSQEEEDEGEKIYNNLMKKWRK